MKLFFDTYALIEIASQNKKYDQYLDSDAVTLVENLVELYHYYLKEFNEKTADYILKKFTRIAKNIEVGMIPLAATLKFKNKKKHFSYIDCLGYTYALSQSRLFVTGDRAFDGLKQVQILR